MRAWELHERFGLDALKQVDRPSPEPGPGQVRVAMRAWSLNFRDLMMIKGMYNPRLRFPFIPLSDGVGEIDTVGAGVTRWKVGQRVAGCFLQGWVDGSLTDAKAKTALGGALPGVAAESVLFNADGLVALPAHLTEVEGAALPCAAVTAWHALVVSGGIKAGDTVLVQGTGGVSLFALQFARLHGARVIATSSSDEKLARLKTLGADGLLNYKQIPEWGDRVRELSGGGVDHVVEVGGAGTLPQSFRAVRTAGHIALIGVLTGGAAEVNPMPVLMRSLRVQGIFVGSRVLFEDMNRAIAMSEMRPVVDRVFRFDELPAALRHLESGQHFGKVCLTV